MGLWCPLAANGRARGPVTSLAGRVGLVWLPASSPHDGRQDFLIGSLQIVAKRAKGLVTRHPLNSGEGHPPANGGRSQGATEAMGAHPLQPQA
jgi:hypothetical protein